MEEGGRDVGHRSVELMAYGVRCGESVVTHR